MSKRLKTTTQLFEIGFKGYYHETSEHYTDHIRAKSRAEALKKFYRKYKLDKASICQAKDLKWWDGDWLMSFSYVKKVKSTVCSHCSGSGKILI